MNIYLYQQVPTTLYQKKRLKSFLGEMVAKEKMQLKALTIIFCSDEYLLQINRKFLQHDFYTDVITFDLSEEKGLIAGEIYISTERVKENAKSFRVKFETELHRVIFHGLLHLCGYKDKTRIQIVMMREKENLYIGQYF